MTSRPLLQSLQEQREELMASLRDLEKQRDEGELIEADYRALRDDYTARAAAVIRALEPHPDPSAEPAPRTLRFAPRARAGSSGGRRSLLVTLAVAVGIVGVAVGSVLVFAGDRQAGQPLSGSLPAREEMPGSGGGTDARLAQAVEFDRQGRGVDALKAYDEILRDEPDNAAALAYRGWLLKRARLIDEAMVALDRAVAVAPTFPDAHFFRGMVLFEDRNDPVGAVAEFEAFLANDPPPEMVPAVVGVLERARAAARGDAGITPP